ncbi:MAG: hypothetical protein JSU95_09895 [Betaproteobacteria bacterium]|nr:MAG: hypothetical protein JSU95_09895 [Betaproteobacteria bacterium]
MRFLTTRVGRVCTLGLPVVLFSSTVAQEGAVLLYEQNYSEAVSFSSADAPLLRDFYVVLSNSPETNWSDAGGVIVTPFETPSLSERYSGSFIVDTTVPKQSGVTLKPAGFDGKLAADSLRLYVGRSKTGTGPKVDDSRAREAALAIVDSKFPIRTLSFVRFDIKEWEVLDSVVSYDIDISFWGKRASEPDTADGLEG